MFSWGKTWSICSTVLVSNLIKNWPGIVVPPFLIMSQHIRKGGALKDLILIRFYSFIKSTLKIPNTKQINSHEFTVQCSDINSHEFTVQCSDWQLHKSNLKILCSKGLKWLLIKIWSLNMSVCLCHVYWCEWY